MGKPDVVFCWGPCMRTRPLFLTAGATVVLSFALMTPAAQAATSTTSTSTPEALSEIVETPGRATSDNDDCSITGLEPQTVTVGIAARTVRFDVSTDCDDADHTMEWAVTGDLYTGSAHATWFGACTYTYTGPATLDCPDGRTTLDLIGTGDFQGNAMAGAQNAYVYAFDDADGDGRDDDTTLACDEDGTCSSTSSGRDNITTSLTLLRRTSWGSTLAGAGTTVSKGAELTLDGRISQADWDTGTNEAFFPTVRLQFRANGEKSFRTVRTVAGDEAGISVTVTAKRSGDFRFRYPGNSTRAASTSSAAHVVVTH